MNSKWNYAETNVAFADGTGTYSEGWYAAAPSTVECGQPPDSGTFETRELAEAAAANLRSEEAGHA